LYLSPFGQSWISLIPHTLPFSIPNWCPVSCSVSWTSVDLFLQHGKPRLVDQHSVSAKAPPITLYIYIHKKSCIINIFIYYKKKKKKKNKKKNKKKK